MLLLAAATLGLVALAKRPRGAAPGGKVTAPNTGWVQLHDMPGLNVRSPPRSWTSPAVRQVLANAGQIAKRLGGTIQLGDVGPPERGSVFKTGKGAHKSHRWGRDMDIAYTFDTYPTPDDVPVDSRVVELLDELAPYIDVVGVNAARIAPFEGHKFKVLAWDGHLHHLHLRLRPELVDEQKPTVATMQAVVLADAAEDD